MVSRRNLLATGIGLIHPVSNAAVFTD